MTTLILLDIETTGLSPVHDQILEIYAIPVDAKTLEQNDPDFHCLCETDMPLDMPVAVLDMHQKSGLLRDLEQQQLMSRRDVYGNLKNIFGKDHRPILCGRNVGTFDRVFLEAKYSRITEDLSYQNFDISTIRNAYKFWGKIVEPAFQGDKHRAKDDVMQDLALLRAWENDFKFLASNPL